MEHKTGQPAPLWDKNTNQGPMRQPRSNQAPKTEPDGPQISTTASILTSSTLNADAVEFYPANYSKESPEPQKTFPRSVHIGISDGAARPSVQTRLHKYKPTHVAQNGHCDDYTPDMMRLKQIISSLKLYPGQFDDLLEIFMETIYPHFNNIIAMSDIARLLFSEAIECANFRYNSAKLCLYVEQKCAEFRAELHLRCKKELQDNQNQQSVLLFIAELYTVLPYSTLYGNLLVDSMKKLVQTGESDNIKCVCQALKLTGYSLDQSSNSSLNEVFDLLRSVRNFMTGNVLDLFNSIVNLRESNWGRGTSEHSGDCGDDEEDYDVLNGIMYETEGQDLTNEEHDFLVANVSHDDYLIDNEDPDALCDPEPEMDEEIQAAFNEFVKLSKG